MNHTEIPLPGGASHAAADNSAYVDWKQWSANDFGNFSMLDGAFFDAEVIPLLSSGGKRVLEVGFGNGPFLGWCKSRGLDYYGIEIDPAMRARARLAEVPVAESIFDSQWENLTGTFDVVAAFDVIEHIEQTHLEPLFMRIRKLLKQGGHFIAKFPNGDSPFGRVNQHGDLTHVTTIGRGKILHLASLCNLTVVSIEDPKRPWRSIGVANAARRLAGGLVKAALEGLVRTLYFGGERISFDRNLVAVLRK